MMRLRIKFILVITILHGVALVLSFYVFKKEPSLFLAAELLLMISAVISWQLYKQMIKPLRMLVDGIEAIKSKDFNVKLLHTGSYEMDQLVKVYNEMMDHLKMERTAQQQQHFFLEKLIHTSPTGILVLDFDEKIHQANPKACALLGIPEKGLLKQPIDQIDQPLVQQILGLKSGASKTISIDGVHVHKLQRSHFIDRGFARSFVMIEELTAEILAAEKKAYGKVIRMMAHEVNNTVGPVNSILDSALKTNDLWTVDHETLKQAMVVAFERNQNLNIFMRNFADVVRLPLPNKAQVNLSEVVGRLVAFFEFKTAGASIQLKFRSPDQPFLIYADQQQLEQALINIIQNAIEAIETDGTIELVLDPQTRTLSISDTGSGISPQQLENLFSPFFSSKKNGQGIGLTLVKEILLNHGYLFSLKTVQPQKTVFEIKFSS